MLSRGLPGLGMIFPPHFCLLVALGAAGHRFSPWEGRRAGNCHFSSREAGSKTHFWLGEGSVLGLFQQHRGILSDPEPKPRWRNHISLPRVRRKFKRLLLFFN